jgi:hypothetical protein
MAAKKATADEAARTGSGELWSKEERAAMQAAAKERKRAARLSPEEARAAGEADVRAAIAAMDEEDGAMAARIHELVVAAAPSLVPRTFYGMPGMAR